MAQAITYVKDAERMITRDQGTPDLAGDPRALY